MATQSEANQRRIDDSFEKLVRQLGYQTDHIGSVINFKARQELSYLKEIIDSVTEKVPTSDTLSISQIVTDALQFIDEESHNIIKQISDVSEPLDESIKNLEEANDELEQSENQQEERVRELESMIQQWENDTSRGRVIDKDWASNRSPNLEALKSELDSAQEELKYARKARRRLGNSNQSKIASLEKRTRENNKAIEKVRASTAERKTRIVSAHELLKLNLGVQPTKPFGQVLEVSNEQDLLDLQQDTAERLSHLDRELTKFLRSDSSNDQERGTRLTLEWLGLNIFDANNFLEGPENLVSEIAKIAHKVRAFEAIRTGPLHAHGEPFTPTISKVMKSIEESISRWTGTYFDTDDFPMTRYDHYKPEVISIQQQQEEDVTSLSSDSTDEDSVDPAEGDTLSEIEIYSPLDHFDHVIGALNSATGIAPTPRPRNKFAVLAASAVRLATGPLKGLTQG